MEQPQPPHRDAKAPDVQLQSPLSIHGACSRVGRFTRYSRQGSRVQAVELKCGEGAFLL